MPLDQETFGHIFYPSFNSIVPAYTQHILPNLGNINNSDSSILIQTYYSMVFFAFKTQIFEKKLPDLLKKP